MNRNSIIVAFFLSLFASVTTGVEDLQGDYGAALYKEFSNYCSSSVRDRFDYLSRSHLVELARSVLVSNSPRVVLHNAAAARMVVSDCEQYKKILSYRVVIEGEVPFLVIDYKSSQGGVCGRVAYGFVREGGRWLIDRMKYFFDATDGAGIDDKACEGACTDQWVQWGRCH